MPLRRHWTCAREPDWGPNCSDLPHARPGLLVSVGNVVWKTCRTRSFRDYRRPEGLSGVCRIYPSHTCLVFVLSVGNMACSFIQPIHESRPSRSSLFFHDYCISFLFEANRWQKEAGQLDSSLYIEGFS